MSFEVPKDADIVREEAFLVYFRHLWVYRRYLTETMWTEEKIQKELARHEKLKAQAVQRWLERNAEDLA